LPVTKIVAVDICSGYLAFHFHEYGAGFLCYSPPPCRQDRDMLGLEILIGGAVRVNKEKGFRRRHGGPG